MNDTSATSQSGASLLPEGIGALTTAHLVLVVLLAAAAVAILVIGARKRAARRQAQREVARNAREAGVAPPAVTASPSPPAPAVPEPAERTSEAMALADEPIAAAAPLDASPASEAASPVDVARPAAPADGSVTQLKGLGPKVSAKLADLGVTTVGQLAALDEDGAAELDARLGPFRGRMARDRWIEQARFLAAGDRAGFEAVFGKL